MKKMVCMLLALLVVFTCVFSTVPTAYAAKKSEKRAIGIVFDNSGSMYLNERQDWCRATYAMEVFAAMLNKGDTLTIYPMWPIEVEGKTYSMESPFTITDASQSSKIREIYSPEAKGTPIETIDFAAKGLQSMTADKKYMIVLTDGDSFYLNNSDLGKGKSKTELDKRFKDLAGPNLTVMYLGVNANTIMPDTAESKYFVKKRVKDSADVLATLTDMCNQIFGRDTLTKNHINGKKVDFDISMSKVIVFVQGENVSDVKVTGAKGLMGTLVSSTATKYSTKGTGRKDVKKLAIDKSLQGMMVTYTDCAAGNYTIDYKGTATSVEVYYEPDADLDFVFTDTEGNMVDPKELYEGEYKVSFGMKDAKTGQLISSDLLGKPHYEGSYSINGKEYPFSKDGQSGEVPVTLGMGDKFDANLTVTYLSDYTIHKDSSDFGWPDGGINVVARPAGDLKVKISGGDNTYPLQTLEKGKPFKVEVSYQGNKLTGKELENVKLSWDENSSYAAIKTEFADDHYKLTLHYKDPQNPADTVTGGCKVSIKATYAAKGSKESKAQATLSYRIEDGFTPVDVVLSTNEDYIVISDLEKSSPITAKLTMNGKPLTAEQFKAVKLKVDCGGVEHKITPNESDSSYSIKLLPTKDIAEDDYPVTVTAVYTDQIGRETKADDTLYITLSNTPLWVKWLFWLLLIALVIFIIWKILHIRVLPKKTRHLRDDCYMSVTGRNVSTDAEFLAKVSGKQLTAKSTYNDNPAGISVSNIKPGKESFLYKSQQKRSMLIDPQKVRMLGEVTYADIGGVAFLYDKNEGKLVPEDPEQRPFMLTHGMTISFDSKVEDNGRTKKAHTDIPLTFR